MARDVFQSGKLVAELRGELESALAAHEDEAAAEAENGYGEWYPDFEEVEVLIEEAGTYLEDAPGDLRELADYAIKARRATP